MSTIQTKISQLK